MVIRREIYPRAREVMFTHAMFHLMDLIQTHKNFLVTLHKLGIITERELQVIQHDAHSKILERVRHLK